MTDTDLDTSMDLQPRRLHFEWVLPLFLHPRRTLEQVRKQENGVWLAPLLVLSALAIIAMICAGGPRQLAAEMGTNLPPNFQWYTPEQQQQFLDAMANARGPFFMIVLPAASALIGIWLSWFLLGSILHLALTMSGSRSSSTASLNLTAWASLPFGVMYIVQAIYYLNANVTIRSPGVSGFIPADATGFLAFIGAMAALLTIYLLWQVILLLAGVVPMTGLKRSKAWFATLLTVFIVLLLQALPGFLSAQLGGLSIIRPFMF
jgi:hypothetical protein